MRKSSITRLHKVPYPAGDTKLMLDTSKESFLKLDPSQTECERQKIMAFLRKYRQLQFCDREISAATHLPINIVESRRNDLLRHGLIVYAGIMHDNHTDRDVKSWRIKQ
jgi:hypothetical protein